ERPLGQLERSRVARIHLDSERNSVPGDEVHAIHALETAAPGDNLSHSLGSFEERLSSRKMGVLHRRQDVAAVPIRGCPQPSNSNELAGDGEGNNPLAICAEDDRCGYTANALLQVTRARDRHALAPGLYCAPATRTTPFEQPF